MSNLTNSSTDSWEMDINPITLIHGINFILGLPLNIYIMVLHFGKRGKVHPSDIFTFNQAAAEIFFILLSPFHAICFVSMKLCSFKPVGFLLGCGMTVRTLIQCLVCLERYIAVVHPVTFLKFRRLRYRTVPSIMAWMIGLECGITGMITYPNLPHKVFIVMYLIVLTLITFCCLSVLKKLKHPGPGDGDKKREAGAKKRAFQIITFNLLALLIQIIPMVISSGIQDQLSTEQFKNSMHISLALNFFTGWLQAVFMLHRAGKLTFIKCTCP